MGEVPCRTLAQHCRPTIIEAHLSVIDEYDTQIGFLEDEVERYVLESPADAGLLTIPVSANSRLQLSLQKQVKLIGLILIKIW